MGIALALAEAAKARTAPARVVKECMIEGVGEGLEG